MSVFRLFAIAMLVTLALRFAAFDAFLYLMVACPAAQTVR
jgi:hypothetical protein